MRLPPAIYLQAPLLLELLLELEPSLPPLPPALRSEEPLPPPAENNFSQPLLPTRSPDRSSQLLLDFGISADEVNVPARRAHKGGQGSALGWAPYHNRCLNCWHCRHHHRKNGDHMKGQKKYNHLFSYLSLARVGGLQSQGAKGEAVVIYREPLATPNLEPSGAPDLSRRNLLAKTEGWKFKRTDGFHPYYPFDIFELLLKYVQTLFSAAFLKFFLIFMQDSGHTFLLERRGTAFSGAPRLPMLFQGT